MGLFSKALAVSTLGASTLVVKATHVAIDNRIGAPDSDEQRSLKDAAKDANDARKAAERATNDARKAAERATNDARKAAEKDALNEAKAAAAWLADAVRVVTLQGSPKDLGRQFAVEIAKQAAQGYAMTSQSTYAGRAHLNSQGIMTIVFTREVG